MTLLDLLLAMLLILLPFVFVGFIIAVSLLFKWMAKNRK